MKTAKLILIVSAFAAPVLLSAQEQSTAPAQAKRKMMVEDKSSPVERYKRGIDGDIKSRKIDLKPILQTSGIDAGLVVAYGHVIASPYKVYLEGQKVMINGVQVSPSLVWEREVPKPVLKKHSVEERTLVGRSETVIAKANQIFCEGDGKMSSEEVSDAVLTYIQQSTDVVVGAKWFMGKKLPMGSIVVSWVNDVGPDAIDFRKSVCLKYKTPQINAAGTKELASEQRHQMALEQYVQSVQRGLRMGQTMIFTSHGEAQVNRDIRREVREIMENKTLSDAEKVEKIKDQNIGYKYSLALDVIENYKAEEWIAK